MKAFTRSSRAFRIGSATTLVGASIALLAGCAPSTPAASPAPTVTVTVTPSASPTSSASASPSPTSSSATSGAAVTIACSSLVSDQIIAALNPKFVPDASGELSGDNSFVDIAKLDGRICTWLDAAAATSLTVGVANPGSAALATNEAKIKASGTSNADLSSGGNRGYVENGTEAPVYDVFTQSGYWISISSVIYDAPSSADSVLSSILQALPSG